MKANTFCQTILMVLGLLGCGVPQTEYDKLKAERDVLQRELDECQNGANRLVALAERAYKEKNYTEAKGYIEALSAKHPESPKVAEFTVLLKEIERLAALQKKEQEAEEKEREKLANLNNTGIWSVGSYVDDFGEPTGKGFVTNAEYISGRFSNTATQNSDLAVKFLISSSTDISIQLHEYARSNPVKSSSSESYSVGVKDAQGNKYKLRATNYSDRLSFDRTDSKKMHSILLKGGQIQFVIVESERPTTEYHFTIDNADWYENAYKKLTDK